MDLSITDAQLLRKLHAENTILKQKNVILTERCQQYTSANKYLISSHKLQIDQNQCEINQLNEDIQCLQEFNRQLTDDCYAFKQKINGYKQKNEDLVQHKLDKEKLFKKLKQCKREMKMLKQQNGEIKKRLKEVQITEITTRQLEITNLKIQLNKLHELFEKNKMRRASNATIQLQISDSVKKKRLSESFTLNCSTPNNKPRFYVHDSYNISPISPYKQKRRHMMDKSAETSDEDNEYKHDNMHTIVHQNVINVCADTLHAYWSYDNELDYTGNQSGYDSNTETQDLVILDAYALSGENIQTVMSPKSPHSVASLILSPRISQTQKADDVETVVRFE